MSKLSEWINEHRSNAEHGRAVRMYDMNTEMMEREFEVAESAGEVVTCQHCGYPENPSGSLEGKSFIKHQCCFDCWYWMHNLGLINGPKRNAVIIGGVHRVDLGPSSDDSRWLGHGGSKWYYRKVGETKIRCTNNMWHQGDIPKRFGIADNAVFCTKEEFDAQRDNEAC